MAIHEASVPAFQEHSRSTDTRAVPVPPAGPNAVEDTVIDGWQRALDGEVMFVDVVEELPHAATQSAAAHANGRAPSARVVMLGVMHNIRQFYRPRVRSRVEKTAAAPRVRAY
jgi:hypothetical protein